jgi:hypothetical protein
MREKYGKEVEFVVVYIAEAHAIDSAWPMLKGPLLEEPETLEERMSNAGKCAVGLELKDFLTVVDGIDDKVMRSWSASMARSPTRAAKGLSTSSPNNSTRRSRKNSRRSQSSLPR